MWPWPRVVPALGVMVVVAMPLMQHAWRRQSEATALAFVAEVQQAQEALRTDGARGYLTQLASLTTPCPGDRVPAMSHELVTALASAGYVAHLRVALGAEIVGTDCHGQPLASDYLVAVQPRSDNTSAHKAFSATSEGRVFLFFDGLAPDERDTAPGGLAVPVEAVSAFTIP